MEHVHRSDRPAPFDPMTAESDRDSAPSSSESNDPDDSALSDDPVARGALLVVAAASIVAFLSFARVILLPIVLAIFLSSILHPPVRFLSHHHFPGTNLPFPRIAAVLLVVLLTVVSTGALAVLLGDQVRRLGAELPRYRNRVAQSVGAVQNRVRAVRDYFRRFLQPIRDRLEPGADETNDDASPPTRSNETGDPSISPPPRNRAPPPASEAPGPNLVQKGTQLLMQLSSSLTGGLSGIFGALAQVLTGIFVLFFTLLEAPAFKSKLLNILGTTDARREAVLDVLRDINRDIQGYLFGRFVINTLLAVVVAFVFFLYGLNYALLVGIFAGLLNFIPYLGAVLGMFIPALIAYMQFGTPEAVVWSALIYLFLTGVEGNLITPIALGRHLQLNSLAVLLGLIFWGWIWGTIGMLLAIPILATIRVVAEHVDGLEPVAELLRG